MASGCGCYTSRAAYRCVTRCAADCFLHDLLGDGGLSLRKERALYLSGDLSGPVQLDAYGVFQDVRPAGSPSLLWWFQVAARVQSAAVLRARNTTAVSTLRVTHFATDSKVGGYYVPAAAAA